MKNLFFYTPSLLIISLIILFSSCSKTEKQEKNDGNLNGNSENSETVDKPSSNTQSANNQVADKTITITNNGKTWATLQINGEKAVIMYDNKNILVHKRKEDKRKYEVGGVIVSEVKYKDEGFKVRTADGQLKWKVKLGEDKVKISNNEENDNAFELKLNENNKAKIKRNENGNDREIATAKEQDNKIIVKSGAKTYEIANQAFHKAYAVLGIDEITEQDRLIILFELLEK